MCNEFRFFTPLRCVQNDREGVLRCVQNDRGRGAALRRGAAFRMTRGGTLRSDDGGKRALRSEWQRRGAALRMTGEGMVYRVNFGVQTHGQIIRHVMGSIS